MFCVYCGAKDAAKFCVRCGRAQPMTTNVFSEIAGAQQTAQQTAQPAAAPIVQGTGKSISDARESQQVTSVLQDLASKSLRHGALQRLSDSAAVPAATVSLQTNPNVQTTVRAPEVISPSQAATSLVAGTQEQGPARRHLSSQSQRSESEPRKAMPVRRSADAPPPLPVKYESDPSKLQGGGDWVTSIDYETVLHAEVPRDRIAMATRRSKPGIGGEDVLKLFDKVSPYGIPITKINNSVLPIYEKLGIKTARQSSMSCIAPAGHVMLAVLCTLAERGLGISDVQQGSMQCTLIADIPLGFITNRGEIEISLQVQGNGQIEVAIETEIFGQLFDWGRSKRLSSELQASIHSELTSISSSAVYQSRAA